MTDFKAGNTAWTEMGEQMHVVDKTVSGSYLVAPMIEFGGGYDEPPTTDLGALRIVEKLYEKAPVHIVDEQFAKVQADVAAARKDLIHLQNTARNEMADRTRLLAKLSQLPALQRIEDYLEGKMDYVVVEDWSNGLRVLPTKEVIKNGNGSRDSWDKTTKLVTLFGDTKGDLQWMISQYRDGGGSARKVWFFATADEAKAFIAHEISKQIGEQMNVYMPLMEPSKGTTLLLLVEQAVQRDIPLTEDMIAARDMAIRQKTEAHRAKLQEQQDKLAAEITAADALLKELPR